MSSRIFINYWARTVRALRAALRQAGGGVPPITVHGRGAIAPGLDFVSEIDVAVRSCDVLLAIIGRDWLDAKDAEGHRRLDNPEDFVRIEIATALKNKVRVIRFWSTAPRCRTSRTPGRSETLSHRQAIELRHNRFAADTQILLKALERGTARLTARRHRERGHHGDRRDFGMGSAAEADICRLGHRLRDHLFGGDRRCLRRWRGD